MKVRRWLCQSVLALAVLSGLSNSSFVQASATGPEEAEAPVTGLLQWQKDGAPVATALGNQREPQIVSDGAGGGIVVWQDFRPYWSSSAPRYLYAQRLSAAGESLWQPDGISIALLGNIDPQVVSDGQGRVIVGWYDVRACRTCMSSASGRTGCSYGLQMAWRWRRANNRAARVWQATGPAGRS
jgi:hypothetical protein